MAPIDEVHLDNMEDKPQARSISGTPTLTDRQPIWQIYPLVYHSIVFIFTFERIMLIRSRITSPRENISQ